MTVCYWKIWFTRKGRLAIAKASGLRRAPGPAAHRAPGTGLPEGRLCATGPGALAQTRGVSGLVSTWELSVCQGRGYPDAAA